MSNGVNFLNLPEDLSPEAGDFVAVTSPEDGLTKKVKVGSLPVGAAVRYDVAQGLSEVQQAQARENVGAMGAAELAAKSSSIQESTTLGGSNSVAQGYNGKILNLIGGATLTATAVAVASAGLTAPFNFVATGSGSVVLSNGAVVVTTGDILQFSLVSGVIVLINSHSMPKSGGTFTGDVDFDGAVTHGNQDLTNSESSLNVGQADKRYDGLIEWLDMANGTPTTPPPSGGAIAEIRQGLVYLTSGAGSVPALATAALIRTMPAISGQGMRPSLLPVVAEVLIGSGSSSSYPDITDYIVFGSHYTTPAVPSASVYGVAIKLNGGNVSLVSSDGTTLAESDVVTKESTAYSAYINYRVEIDGTEARLFQKINDDKDWTLRTTVTHPTPNFTFPNLYYGMSAMVEYTATVSPNGANRPLSVHKARVAAIGGQFL